MRDGSGPRAALRASPGALRALCLLALWTLSPPARAAPARPDRALFQEARQARAALEASKKPQGRNDWERVVLRFRRIVARYPQSPYCDDSLLAIGDLYRQMARRFDTPRYRDDAIQAYRTLVDEYPSSSLGEQALHSVFDIARESGDRKRTLEAGRAYLDAYGDARRAAEVKSFLRKGAAVQPISLPSPPPPGLAKVFNVRFWSGDASTRIVVDLEKEVPIKHDRISGPDRLWVDLVGTRLHPSLKDRTFHVGDGLLEQIRIAQNRDNVVRIVIDFKDVKDHSVLYLHDPTRLVIDVHGSPSPKLAIASDTPATPAPAPSPGTSSPGPVASDERSEARPDRLPSRRVTGFAQPASPPPPVPPPPLPPPPNRNGVYSVARQLALGARRIVVDAGHGGHDPGTIGRGGLQEKDLVLDVALRLETLARSELPDVEVVMTRSTDVFVPLEERTAIANSKAADLFLSIHANSSRNPTARGIETYFLNFAVDPHAEAVAARENAISTATLKDLQGLVKAIALNSKINESRDFAASVQEALVHNLRPRYPEVEDRGVHTAPFYVLIGANMPSILAEIAFVSHPNEERRLKTSDYRDRIARSLLEGVRGYLSALNRTQTAGSTQPPGSTQARQLTAAGRRSTVASRETRR